MSSFECLTGSNMTKINLSNNCIDKQTVIKLSVFLSHCTKLEELNLANNNLQTAGSIELFENLTCITLKIINISHNCITIDAAYHIAKTLSMNYNLQEVNLSCNVLQNVGVREILSSINMANLTKLNISNNEISGRSIIQYIFNHAINLVALDFSDNNLYLTNIYYCCFNLIQLNVSYNRIADAALKFILANNSRLQELDISYNALGTTNICTIFRNLNISLLTKFNASNNTIGEQAANDMGRLLSQNTKLKVLDISCNKLKVFDTKKLFKRITNLSKLTKLKFHSNLFTHLAADAIATVLLHNPNLEEIDLSNNNLLAAGAISIFNAMKDVSTLSCINISHNWITSEAADDVAVVLSQNVYMKEVHVAKNYLEASGIIALCKGMSKFSYLTHLDMSCNKITDKVAHDIAVLLFHNPELRELDLSNNLIQAPGAIKVLRTHSCLSKINICRNVITDEAADAIAKFLSQNTKLKEFDVSYNKLQANGAVKILQAIKKSNLLKLNISSNLISEDAVDIIISVLSAINKSIEVNLENNKMISIHRIQKCVSKTVKLIV